MGEAVISLLAVVVVVVVVLAAVVVVLESSRFAFFDETDCWGVDDSWV